MTDQPSSRKKRNYLGSIGGILLSTFSILILLATMTVVKADPALLLLLGLVVVQFYLTYLKIVEFKTSAAVVQFLFTLMTIGVTLIFEYDTSTFSNAAERAGAEFARILAGFAIFMLLVDVFVTYARNKNSKTVNYQDIYD